jgi:hypothetical protein
VGVNLYATAFSIRRRNACLLPAGICATSSLYLAIAAVKLQKFLHIACPDFTSGLQGKLGKNFIVLLIFWILMNEPRKLDFIAGYAL